MAKQSAKQIPPYRVDTLFDVPLSKLRSIVEQAIQVGPVIELAISIEHEIVGSGMSSEIVVPTISYQTRSGAQGEIRMLVKRQLKLEHQEAQHYLAAEKAGIPTPRYFGHGAGSWGEEVLFLEFLPECGIDDQNEAEVRSLVNLVACINTAPLRFTEFKILDPGSQEKQVDAMHKGVAEGLIPQLRQIWKSGAAGEVNPSLQRLCHAHPQGVEVLQNYIFDLHQQIATLPQDALVQGDTGPHQMGWRLTPQGKALLVFDLDWRVGRRFHDIGYILHNYLGDSVLSQTEIATHYLAAFQRWGGDDVALADFLEATRWLADEDKLWFCPWLWETALKQIAGGDAHVDANPNNFPTWLTTNLSELLEAASA